MTFGATLGALTLATLTLPWSFLAGAPITSAKLAHGYAQVFGFATLFIMGVAYHVMPRFKSTPLATQALASASFWLQTGGVLVIAIGLLAGPPIAAPARLVGAVALLVAALAFGWTAHRTLATGTPTPERLERSLRAGCIWLVVATTLAVVAAAGMGTLQPAVWEAALWGFVGSWILGMSLRIVPVSMGLPPVRGRSANVLFGGYQAAAAIWITVSVVETWALAPYARAIAGIALVLAVGAFVLQIGILEPRAAAREAPAQGYEPFIVAAYAWLVAALVFAPGWSAAAALAGGSTPWLLLDFGRHAFTIGFLTQILFGVATRIVPVFMGAPLWSPTWRRVTFYCLNAAVAVRGLEVVIELAGFEGVWPYIALSGPLGVTAFSVFAANFVGAMRARPAVAAAMPATAVKREA